MSTTTSTRPPAGYTAAGEHHGYLLASPAVPSSVASTQSNLLSIPHSMTSVTSRSRGPLITRSGNDWSAVAVVVAASGDQVTVRCPHCPPDHRGRPALHYHGRAGESGEGHRASHCRGQWRGDYIVLDLDDLTAAVPLSPAQRKQHHPQLAAVTPIHRNPQPANLAGTNERY